MATTTPQQPNPGPERWLSKREIAEHYGFTTKWVEMMVRRGMPSRMIGGRRRFRLSDVDPWLDGLADAA